MSNFDLFDEGQPSGFGTGRKRILMVRFQILMTGHVSVFR
jgi:hypothetical protein